MKRRSEQWIGDVLADLSGRGLARRLTERSGVGGRIHCDGTEILNLSSNDYLDLAGDRQVCVAAKRAVEDFGSGAASSRLVTGSLACHSRLEERIAELKGYPAALIFGSGYLANAGIIPALVGRGDDIYADKLVHASIVDGMLLSKAKVHRFKHNNPEHLESLIKAGSSDGRKLVVTESVFSMDGDIAPLEDVSSIADTYDAMVLVDEAHATGVFGQGGSGLVRKLGLESSVNVSMGTMSKALGSYGGFIACSEDVRMLAVNRARTFIYTTALPPAAAGAALAALDSLVANPDAGQVLLGRAAALRQRLRDGGLDTGASESQIIPVMVGEAEKAAALACRLEERGILAVAIRPPTVPQGTSRLRLSVTLAHTDEDLERAANVIIECSLLEGIL